MSDEKRAQDSQQARDLHPADASAGGSPPASEATESRSDAPSRPAEAAPSESQPSDAPKAEPSGSPSSGTGTSAEVRSAEEGVYFFPEENVTAAEARRLIESGSRQEKARVVSHLLTYAEYAEIWTWVDRDLVRDLFDDLEMPDRLRTAWARNLGLVAKTG